MKLIHGLTKLAKCCLILALLIVLFAPFAGDYLVIDEKPEKSDAIIVLSGDGERNLKKGIDLFKQGYARFLVLSNANDDGMLNQIRESRISLSSVILETEADSTYTNALFTKDLLVKHQVKSAIIITPDFHMRRVKYHFERIYAGTGITFTYSAIQTPGFNSRFWWEDERSRKIVFTEYIKFVGNMFGMEGAEYKEYLYR